MVNDARHLALAGARVSGDENAHVERRHHRRFAKHVRECFAAADDPFCAQLLADGFRRIGRVECGLPSQQAIGVAAQMTRDHLDQFAVGGEERFRLDAALEIEDADGNIGADRRAEYRGNAPRPNALVLVEARVEECGVRSDDLAGLDRGRHDAAGDRTADLVDLVVREAVRRPPTGNLGFVVAIAKLEVALVRARDVAHEAERFLEKRRDLLDFAQFQQAPIEVALVLYLRKRRGRKRCVRFVLDVEVNGRSVFVRVLPGLRSRGAQRGELVFERPAIFGLHG